MRHMRFLWAVAAGGFAASVAAAAVVRAFMHGRVAIIGSFLGLQHSENAGVAFGMELGALEPLLIAVAGVAVLVMAVKSANSPASQWGFGLIIGGGAANIVDRLPDGMVTDVFQVGAFPIFNLADSCITIGVALLLLDILQAKRKGVGNPQ